MAAALPLFSARGDVHKLIEGGPSPFHNVRALKEDSHRPLLPQEKGCAQGIRASA